MSQDPINLKFTTIKQPLPDFIYAEMKDYVNDANGYRSQPEVLREKLAAKHNIDAENIFLTAGIDEAIQIMLKSYPGRVLAFTPTYIVYADAEIFGSELIPRPSLTVDDYQIDTGANQDVDLIFLANPSNPCGFTSREKIIELLENNSKSIVCIDEAYGEFAPELSVIDLLEKYSNLVVFRSFSKDYAMAGVRIAYLMASQEIIKHIAPKTQWCNVSYPAVGCALAGLNHEEYFANMRQQIIDTRAMAATKLKQLGLHIYPSKINAILMKFETEVEATKLVEYLDAKNIIISHGNGSSNIGLDNTFVRVAIGSTEQMQVFVEVVSKL